MTEEQIMDGKCDGVKRDSIKDYIIPPKARTIPKDKSVFEFKSSAHKTKDGSYKQYNPGFMDPSKHPRGLCIPCCFGDISRKSTQERIKLCTSPDISKNQKVKH